MNEKMKSITVLCSICLIVAVLLSGINFFTAPIIKENEDRAVAKALSDVYPGLKSAEKIDLRSYNGLPTSVVEAYAVKDLGGYVLKLVTTGYASDFVILCGVSAEGAVVGAKCLSSKETNGAEKTYGENLINKTLDNVESVDTVSGSTKTTSAYKNAVKDALGAAAILGGGSYDGRSEEEIKLDEALPLANEEFELQFFAEYVPGLTKLYKAKNGAGYVFVFGDDYIGTDPGGAVVSGAESAYAASVPDALCAILATSFTALDPSLYKDMETRKVKLVSVEKTATGNYVVTLTTDGYSVTGEHNYTGVRVPIKLRLSISSSGVIICAETLVQAESENYGDGCASPDFYTQYNGKDSSNYEGIDGVSGATVTTNAYKAAVKVALDTVTALESK